MNRLMTAIERILALAFIAAVCLNFANVVGRYGFGRSIAAADEIQIYIMVFMAFLGAAVVSWRRQHLRMDVLVRFLPPGLQSALRICEIVLVAAVAGFVLVQSWRYSAQMLALGRSSDVGGIPMWIPHGAVTLGFFLILIVSLRNSK
ncbi:MAG TPA: TRAP transporter small permease [Burkholderiales bacterium]|jgi:TRAP-type C4-dicarboxylate transport system permease small subunit